MATGKKKDMFFSFALTCFARRRPMSSCGSLPFIVIYQYASTHVSSVLGQWLECRCRGQEVTERVRVDKSVAGRICQEPRQTRTNRMCVMCTRCTRRLGKDLAMHIPGI